MIAKAGATLAPVRCVSPRDTIRTWTRAAATPTLTDCMNCWAMEEVVVPRLIWPWSRSA